MIRSALRFCGRNARGAAGTRRWLSDEAATKIREMELALERERLAFERERLDKETKGFFQSRGFTKETAQVRTRHERGGGEKIFSCVSS